MLIIFPSFFVRLCFREIWECFLGLTLRLGGEMRSSPKRISRGACVLLAFLESEKYGGEKPQRKCLFTYIQSLGSGISIASKVLFIIYRHTCAENLVCDVAAQLPLRLTNCPFIFLWKPESEWKALALAAMPRLSAAGSRWNCRFGQRLPATWVQILPWWDLLPPSK